MKKGSDASKISDIVNSTLFNPLETGVEFSTEHRYLVNKMFKMFLHFAGQLSRNQVTGNFDGRNEFACKCSKIMVDALIKENLYDEKWWNERYDEILKNL